MNAPDRMLVVVPTRGRPENVSRQQLAMMETRSSCDVLYAVDDDDPRAIEYCRMDGISVSVGPRMRLGPTLNFYAVREAHRYDVIGFMGDDHLPRTPFWDQDAGAAVMDGGKPRVVYGNDLLQGQNLATAVFLPARVVAAMGYMSPPEIRHLWIDNAWMSLGRALGELEYLEHVVIEHMHPAAGKAQMDPGYAECNTAAVNDADRAAYERWRDGGEMAAAVDRIRKEYGL